MELVALPVARVLNEAKSVPRYAHFLVSGLASQAISLKNGDGIDLGIVGTEGLVEAISLAGSLEVNSQTMMQVEGAAYRIAYQDLKAEFQLSSELRTLVLQSLQQQCLLTSQLAACNYFHELDARLARWLLMVSDRAKSPRFRLTHGFLAQMLGVRRPSLTLTATRFQREGAIRYQRGSIEICNRNALLERACECYENITHLYQQTDEASSSREK